MRLLKFPDPSTKKLGPKRVHKKREEKKSGQLNLFSRGKVLRLNQVSSFGEALMLDNRGNREAAKKLYQKAIKNEECVADAYCNLGILESQDENFVNAIEALTKSLKFDPRHYEAHYNLANIYAEIGNFALAKIHYKLSISFEPSFANNYFNLALTLACLEEYEEAIGTLKTYRSMAPKEEHKPADNLIEKLQGRKNA